MQQLDFLKLIPGGNPTILVTTPVESGQRMALANKLMHPLHLQAEQVGYINLDAAPPSLDMMGGEFCLNATRSLVFEMARQKLLFPLDGTDDLFGLAQSSGAEKPLQVRVKNGKALVYPKKSGNSAGSNGVIELSRATGNSAENSAKAETGAITSLDCLVSVEVHVDPDTITEIEPGAILVRLPGISHLLLDESIHRLPEREPSPERNGASAHCSKQTDTNSSEHGNQQKTNGSSERNAQQDNSGASEDKNSPGNDSKTENSAASGWQDAVFRQANVWLDRLGLKNEPACGAIWFRALDVPPGFIAEPGKTVLFREITPVVHVAATQSCILESACGSATLALGIFEAVRQSGGRTNNNTAKLKSGQLFLNVRQPSGQNLRQKVVYSSAPCEYAEEGSATSQPKGASTSPTPCILRCEAEVGGIVRLCASGATFV
ncbi:hypothetical protein LJC48_03570 [Desulfovibrio sp. OttesenSCG-928-C06]|nr:hypothetical protein [Desulfovibrio sp. OttesenSCG-928-C06]